MSQPDRESVTLEFKFSKNYNSVGAAISFSSDRKEGEDNDQLFNRVYKEAEVRFDQLVSKAEKVLG